MTIQRSPDHWKRQIIHIFAISIGNLSRARFQSVYIMNRPKNLSDFSNTEYLLIIMPKTRLLGRPFGQLIPSRCRCKSNCRLLNAAAETDFRFHPVNAKYLFAMLLQIASILWIQSTLWHRSDKIFKFPPYIPYKVIILIKIYFASVLLHIQTLI